MRPLLCRPSLRLPLILASFFLVAPQCGERMESDEPAAITSGSSGSSRPAKEIRLVTEPDFEGFRIALSEADPQTSTEERTTRPVADTTPLDPRRTSALLARLPALETEDGDRADFAKRPDSLPAPRTGETVETTFPPEPPDYSPVVEQGPLSVIRHAPEGDVYIAPHLTVTFSQPMVAVTSQDEAAAVQPVAISPAVEGDWRWLGTKTTIFEPTSRFPMATEYTVTVPAGTSSVTDGTLAEGHTFTFRTPPPRLLQQHPVYGPQKLQPVIFLGFDQAIDADALVARLSVKAGRDKIAVRAATAEEIEADATVRSLSSSAPPDRWIAVIPVAPLPKDTNVNVTLPKGSPSAEGPRTTESDQGFSFRTFGPLRIEEHRCSWGDNCPPNSDWYVRFTNPLDLDAFDGTAWTVSPEVRALNVNPGGNTVNIRSVKKGRTTYTVTVPGGTRDVFGQTLGADKELTFKVGPADGMMAGPGKEFMVLDPASPPSIPLYSINHKLAKLKVFRVTSADWGPLSKWMQQRWNDRRPKAPPLERLASTTIPIEEVADDLVETPVDLSEWMDGPGGLFVWIEPAKQHPDRWRRIDIFTYVQRTPVGIAAFHDSEELLGWVTDLQTGKAAEGVTLSIFDTSTATHGPDKTTDAQGVATLPLPKSGSGTQLLVARKDGKELGFLPQNVAWWSNYAGWVRQQLNDELRWMVYDDRGLYRPGETVSVKGFVRRHETRRGGQQGAADATQLGWTLYDSRGNELSSGRTEINAHGAFFLTTELPPNVNLGNANLSLQALNGTVPGRRSYNHTVKIAEFRRPEFEVKASADPGPYVLGEHAIVEVEAKYFAGGALPEAETTWSARTSPSSYKPPGWDRWSFGVWSPWWRIFEPSGGGGGSYESLQGTTDGLGTHRLKVDFLQMNPPRPWSVDTEATVMDVNRQAWTAKQSLLVHPAALYAGLKLDKGFVEQGEELSLSVAAVDIEGAAAAGRAVSVVAERLEWTYAKGSWSQVAKESQTCDATSTGDMDAPATCTFVPELGGSWRITGRVTDEAGRASETTLQFWVRGGKGKPQRNLSEEELTLIPNEKEYAIGEVAKILVQAPFAPWEGLATWQRQGIVKSLRFTAEGPTHVLEVPIEEAYLPGLTVRVDAVGQAERLDAKGEPAKDKPPRPAFASGSVALAVPPVSRGLTVQVTPRDEVLQPGESTTVDLSVVGADGKPVSGVEFAVSVVDESVLSLTGYQLPSPLEIFYAARPPGVTVTKLRQHVVLADLSLLPTGGGGGEGAPGGAFGRGDADGGLMLESAGAAPPSPSAPRARRSAAPMAKAESMAMDMEADAMEPMEQQNQGQTGTEAPKVELRSNFAALALFAPSVMTDTSGKASVPVDLPDNLTRYRVMVVAVDKETRFGTGEAAITARRPVMVRPSPPRFLNFGDTFELPFVVQNQTREELAVDLAVRTANMPLTGAPEGAAVRVTVPAEDRVEVRFPAAADMAGTARFQVLAVAKVGKAEATDAAGQDLPVWTPATSEAFATYGVIDEGAIRQPVQTPGEVWPQFGGLEITTSSTALQALTDAVIYLANYRFACAEQLSSRLLGIAALRDVLEAFEADELPSPKELNAIVASDLETLKARQNPDGGFGFWRRGQKSWPWVSIHAAHAQARAKAKGYSVDAQMLRRSENYLRRVEQYIPHWYSERSRHAIIAYAVFVRDLLDDKGAQSEAKKLYAKAGLDGLSMESLGFLLPVLDKAGATAEVAAIERHFVNRVSETAGAAHFVESYSDGAHVLMHSNRRSDGVILEALTRVRPDNDLIPKVVEGLLGHRTRGRWLNTQENVFVLLALDRYFNTFEKTTPDFVARVWLGQDYAGDHTFKGRTTERALTTVAMAKLAKTTESQDLVLQKDGAGRMYYRIGMKYAPRSLKLEPADRGFAVERTYEAVDDPADVSRDDDGTWRIKAGARVRVRLTMVATGRRVHVALVDPLPAGLEPVNPELATSGSAPPDAGALSDDPGSRRGYWWWWRPWYEHENLRDERVEAFTNLLWEGVHKYTYLARATTPGNFVVPPTKAEEMYNPETFGRSATDRVVVED